MHSRWPLVSNALGRLITHRARDARWVMRWANPHAVLATLASCALAMPPLMAVPRTTTTRRTARRAAVMAAPVHRDEVITEQAGLTGPNVHFGPDPAQPERYPALGGMNRPGGSGGKMRKTPACTVVDPVYLLGAVPDVRCQLRSGRRACRSGWPRPGCA